MSATRFPSTKAAVTSIRRMMACKTRTFGSGQDSVAGTPKVLLDPNTLSKDGTVAVSGLSVSHDGKLLAYSISGAGSDWQEWHVRDVATGSDLSDDLKWVKFSGASWSADNKGIFYSRYEEPNQATMMKATNYFQKLYFHKLGTPQSEDVLVYETPDHKDWQFMVTSPMTDTTSSSRSPKVPTRRIACTTRI